jgi:hypothetical protein
MMGRNLHWLPALLAGLTISGCATSDDPRQGGLIGYWQHGEKGYQQRLEQRQAEVEAAKVRADSAQDESLVLEGTRDLGRQEVAAQRERLNALRVEIQELQQTLAAAPVNPEQAPATGELQREVEHLSTQLRDLDTDTTLLIQDRQRRIGELKKELKMLRERASLLTTL